MPQFLAIRTAVQLRDGTTMETFERCVMTFRSYGDPDGDRARCIQ